MKHDEIRHMLSEYIDGAVTPKEKALIDDHIKSCRECSNALAELRKTIEHIKKVEEVESPPWLSQKIMAKVRVEAEEKTSVFRQFFSPAAVKIPLQAVAVLFVAVTGYFIYQNISPGDNSEAPVSIAAKKEPPASTSEPRMDERKMKEGGSSPLKKVPQTPGYKSLDMKPMYEKPAPAAPARPKPAEESGSGYMAEDKESRPAERNKALSMRQDAPAASKQQETYSPSAGSSAIDELDRLAAAPETKSNAMTFANKKESDFRLSITVKDTVIAEQKILKAIEEVSGKVIKSVSRTAVSARINSSQWDAFTQKLKRIGELKLQSSNPETRGDIDIRIDIVNAGIVIK